MAITRKKKEEVLAEVRDIAVQAKTLVFANFKGLTVSQQTEMRRALRSQGVGYRVAKKTLITRVLEGGTYEGTLPELQGEIALVSGSDELAPAREFAVFVKKFPEQLGFAGGIFGGKFISASEMKSIAAIPPLGILRGQFVHVINAPLQRLAVVLSKIAEKKAA